MRVALISDIHGNLVALETVLAEIERDEPDHIVCLGDVAATGPRPHETVERLRALEGSVVMGNTDAPMLGPMPEVGAHGTAWYTDELDSTCADQL